ncbi:MAG: hypothetical protein NQ127_01230 [Candidatus Cardinium sp.]|nr:hypothetical protein [Candidatus Cardinium sp.]
MDQLSLERSHAVINNLVPMVALAQELQWSISELVQWNINKYYTHGYHDSWVRKHNWGNVQVYATFFLQGRKLVSERDPIIKHTDTIIVESTPWYLVHAVHSLFFYDIELEHLLSFIGELATAHAKLCGVKLKITYKKNKEMASFFY